MEWSIELFNILLILCLLTGLGFTFKTWKKLKEYESKISVMESKYSPIIDIHAEIQKLQNESALEMTKLQNEKNEAETNISKLKCTYKEKKNIFDKLIKEVAIYDEEIELAELGFYKPHFNFGASEKYKEEITKVRQEQKSMISSKKAIYCATKWQVEGSYAKGETMTNRGIRLTARAFNNECEAVLSNVNWNNISRMEQRITKACEAINKLNESNKIIISLTYFQLKLKELRLTYEYASKKQHEKEEQQEIKRQMREELKLELEIDKAQKEEEKYNKLLEKAMKDAEEASGNKLDSLRETIDQLNKDLKAAHDKNERAKSMAEMTKRGHVYVISNIGSFGEEVYKIGMTRRLEPLDRVKELGDASVPFTFDVHAMIFSDNAPELENALHKRFDQARLNLVNNRKEFFRVRLIDIKNEVKKISTDAEFIETAEAKDYRESLAIIAQRQLKSSKNDFEISFPEAI